MWMKHLKEKITIIVTLFGKTGLNEIFCWKAFQHILNALQCIATDSNDSQRIYNVFLQTQAVVFNVLKCFPNV